MHCTKCYKCMLEICSDPFLSKQAQERRKQAKSVHMLYGASRGDQRVVMTCMHTLLILV